MGLSSQPNYLYLHLSIHLGSLTGRYKPAIVVAAINLPLPCVPTLRWVLLMDNDLLAYSPRTRRTGGQADKRTDRRTGQLASIIMRRRFFGHRLAPYLILSVR